MRKTNKLLAGLLSLCLAVSVSALPALAAEGDASSTEATTYVVTFRPGEHGKFTDSFIAGLATYGEVKTSEATGAVAVRLNEGAALPNAPQLTDIVMNEDASRYFVTDAAQGYTGGTASGDLSTVAQYALSASDEDAVFTVQYLDRETGAEVAPSLQGSAPVGQNLTFYALNNIENYTAETASQQLTVSSNADQNVVTFYYTAAVNNVTETVTVPGGTITQYEDQTVVGGAAVAGGGAGVAGGAGGAGGAGAGTDEGGDTVTIPETETPQAGGDNTPGGEDVEIPDESTPQANLPGENTSGNVMPMVIGGAVAAIVVIAAVVWAINRKKNAEGE